MVADRLLGLVIIGDVVRPSRGIVEAGPGVDRRRTAGNVGGRFCPVGQLVARRFATENGTTGFDHVVRRVQAEDPDLLEALVFAPLLFVHPGSPLVITGSDFEQVIFLG
ncbi:MAG: hypothetical protein P6D50_04665, partial [Acidimicrobiales bacterium]|nr:hypothetical protein [Acidimicrobiales bacterium]